MKTARLFYTLIAFATLFVACKQKITTEESQYDTEAQQLIDSIADIDELLMHADRFARMKEKRAEAIVRETIGKIYRDNSDFENAIIQHDSAIALCVEIDDTIHRIKALNQQGTNFRRLGDMDEASQLHCRALELCDELKNDTSYEVKKSRLVSLNGLGNALMTMGNYETAENIFRRALKGEQMLGSAVGEAINYANIGSVFEHTHQPDSARTYYMMSMEKNKESDNAMGIGLCHQYLGKLDEAKGDIAAAKKHYQTSYEILYPTNDSWHWLEATLSLSKLYLETNVPDSAKKYIEISRKTAESINSKEHLVKAYLLAMQFEETWGSKDDALELCKLGNQLDDSLHSQNKYAKIQNLRVNYEIKRRSIEVQQAKEEARLGQTITRIIFWTSIVVFVIMCWIIYSLIYFNNIRKKTNIALKHSNANMEKASKELRQADRELRMADEELRRADRERQDFYRDIAHRFRTPLTVVIGMTQQLREHISKDDEQAQGDFLAVERQNEELLRLVNEMMHKLQPNASTATVTSINGDIQVDDKQKLESEYIPEGEESGTNMTFASPDKDGKRPLVLLAEDNEDVARYQCELLERNGYRVNWATDGVQALELLKEEMPMIIVTDIMMPNMDGLELCRTIRSNEATSHIPLIIVTARVEDRDRMKGLEAGAEVYLTKPFLGRELLLNMKNLLEIRSKYTALPAQNDDSIGGNPSNSADGESTPQEQSRQKFIKMIDEVIDANLSDTEFSSTILAANMCLSRAQLNRRVNTELGTDTTHYIRERRLKHACHMLRHTDMSIMDIQIACGFDSPGYFSRVFKQHFEKSPSDYRKER